MEAEDLVVDEGGEGKIVEEVGEVLPHICVSVFAKALIIKAIHLCDLARLVVASENSDTLWVSNLQGHKEGHGLDGVVSTVNIVA